MVWPPKPFVFRTLVGPVKSSSSATRLLITDSLAPRSLITLISNDPEGFDGFPTLMTSNEMVFCRREIALYSTAGLS